MQLLIAQIIDIQNSGKLAENLLAICIMQSVRPGENETSGITTYFCLYSKEPRFVARKGFLTDLGEKDFLLAARK